MGIESKSVETQKDPLRLEYDRIISECDKKRGMLQQAAQLANTPEELKFVVRLGATIGKGVGDIGTGEYITSSLDNHIVPVERVSDAIDQYASKQRWVGYGGDIPPYIGERLEELYGKVNQNNEI